MDEDDDFYVDCMVDLNNSEVEADLDGRGLVLIKRVRLDELIQKAQTTQRLIEEAQKARAEKETKDRNWLEWDRTLAKARGEAKLLREQLVAAQASLSRVQDSNNDMNAELVKMRAELAETRKQRRDAFACNNVFNAKIVELREKLSAVCTERDDLRAKISALQEGSHSSDIYNTTIAWPGVHARMTWFWVAQYTCCILRTTGGNLLATTCSVRSPKDAPNRLVAMRVTGESALRNSVATDALYERAHQALMDRLGKLGA